MLGVLPSVIRQEKKIKGTQFKKIKIKLFLLPDSIIVYIENPKESGEKTLLELIGEFSKVKEYETNIYK